MAKAGRKPKETPAVDIEDVLEMPYFQDSYWLWYDFINELENNSFLDELIDRHSQSLNSSNLSIDEKRKLIRDAYTKFADGKIAKIHFELLAIENPSKSIVETADLILKFEKDELSFTEMKRLVAKINYSAFEKSLISGFFDLINSDINSTQDPKAGLIRRIKKLIALIENEKYESTFKKVTDLLNKFGKIKSKQDRNRFINEFNTLMQTEIDNVDFSSNIAREIMSINEVITVRDRVGVNKKTALTRAQISQRLKSWFVQFGNVKCQYDWLLENCYKIVLKHFSQYLMTGRFNFEHYPEDAAMEMVIHIFRKGNYNHTLNEGQRYEFLKKEIESYFVGDMRKTADSGEGLGSIDKKSNFSRNYFSESYKQERLSKKINPESFIYQRLFDCDYRYNLDLLEVMLEESAGRNFGESGSKKIKNIRISEIDRPVKAGSKAIKPKSTLKKKSA
jgi:hypothetical protein